MQSLPVSAEPLVTSVQWHRSPLFPDEESQARQGDMSFRAHVPGRLEPGVKSLWGSKAHTPLKSNSDKGDHCENHSYTLLSTYYVQGTVTGPGDMIAELTFKLEKSNADDRKTKYAGNAAE